MAHIVNKQCLIYYFLDISTKLSGFDSEHTVRYGKEGSTASCGRS